MILFVEASTVAFIIGILFGVAAILYFAKDILISLSITVKTAILYACFIVFFVFSLSIDGIFSIILISLAGGSYLASLQYTLTRYDFSRLQVFGSLTFSAVLFIAGGYLIDNEVIGVGIETAGIITGVIAAIIIILVIIDVREEDIIRHELESVDEIIINDFDSTVGYVSLESNSKFRRGVDVPGINVVLSEEEQRVPFTLKSDLPDVLKAGEIFETEVRIGSERLESICEEKDIEIQDSYEVSMMEEDEFTFVLESVHQ